MSLSISHLVAKSSTMRSELQRRAGTLHKGEDQCPQVGGEGEGKCHLFGGKGRENNIEGVVVLIIGDGQTC